MQNTPITRLVTGFSNGRRKENLDEPGFVKATDSGSVPVSQRPPSLKPAHPGFFMLVCSYTRQGASANRSEWTVPKRHRHCIHPQARRPAFLSGTEQGLGITVETGPFRLNDSLKGLWVTEQDSVSGSGKESSDSTLARPMEQQKEVF